MNKHWQKFYAKLDDHKNIHQSYWSEYELLGFWRDLSGMTIEPGDIAPSRHPQLQKIRILIWMLETNSKKPHGHSAPTYYSSENVKRFLEWCWVLMQKTGYKCKTSLTFITGDQKNWIKNYREDNHIISLTSKNTEININDIDIGEPADFVHDLPASTNIRKSTQKKQLPQRTVHKVQMDAQFLDWQRQEDDFELDSEEIRSQWNYMECEL